MYLLTLTLMFLTYHRDMQLKVIILMQCGCICVVLLVLSEIFSFPSLQWPARWSGRETKPDVARRSSGVVDSFITLQCICVTVPSAASTAGFTAFCFSNEDVCVQIVLEEAGRPMHIKEIKQRIIDRGLVQSKYSNPPLLTTTFSFNPS